MDENVEYVSLMHATEYLVQSGYDPEQIYGNISSEELRAMEQVYVPLPFGWQQAGPEPVAAAIGYGSEDVTPKYDSTGKALIEGETVLQGANRQDRYSAGGYSQLGATEDSNYDPYPALEQPYQEMVDGAEQPVSSDYGYDYGGYGGGYGNAYRGGYSRGGYSGGGYSGGGYGGGGYSGSDGAFSQVPRYANGSIHPFFGGPPPVPGGQFAFQPEGEEEFDTRRQMYVPGGASAGPFSTESAPLLGGRTYGGNSVDADIYRTGGAGGGGGGGASDTYWNLRNKFSNLGGGTGGYSGYSSGYSGYGSTPEPKAPRNHGFSRRYDEDALAGTIQFDPTAILPELPSVGRVGDLGYQYLEEQDAANLTMLTAGARGKSWLGKEKVDRKTGYVTPAVPNTGKYTNKLAQTYEGILNETGPYQDPNALEANLLNARRKSSLGSQFGRKVPAGQQAYAMGGYLETIANLQPAGTEDAYMRNAQNQIDLWLNRAMQKKKPGNLQRYLRNQGI